MSLTARVVAALVLVTVSVIYEAYMNRAIPCCKAAWPVATLAFLINFAHHVLSVYMWFGGFLFGAPLVHLPIVLGVFALWRLFGSECILHVWYQRLCGYKTTPFYDLFDLITSGNGRVAKDYASYVVIAYDVCLIGVLVHLKLFKSRSRARRDTHGSTDADRPRRTAPLTCR